MSDVFQRQRGLVDQAKLSKLSVRLADRAVFPQQFIQSFELIGQQLGVNQFCQNQQALPKIHTILVGFGQPPTTNLRHPQ